MIRAMDIGIKQVYEAAQEQSDRETILVFTSDNGAATRYRASNSQKPFANAKFYSATGCNFPLKGRKSSLNEAGFQNCSIIQIRLGCQVYIERSKGMKLDGS